MPKCKTHPETTLICPKCIASTGGKATAAKHSHAQLSAWGKRGGRPKKEVKK